MPILLGIDTGGTYTDAVLFDEDHGVMDSAKSLTTKHDLSIGVSKAAGAVLPQDPSVIRLVSISTTLATNAIVEGHGNPVCLILIGQRADALERSRLGQVMTGDPVVFVAGGHGADGVEREPLDEGTVRDAILTHAPRVSAFAVAGYFAVRNAAHEEQVRDLVHELTSLPVTCSHELTTNLDAPRRALTAVLNARLIPVLHELILVVEQMLSDHNIHAPLMVVMGDGSLISAQSALTRPVETILSGPAASVVGARYLCGAKDGYVVDMGGTTTDIALLRGGWPALNRDGATVAGWRTMVEAVDVHTVGLGGDSEVRVDETGELIVGPRRVLPLSLLAKEYPTTLSVLRTQLGRGYPRTHDGRFALRLRRLNEDPGPMTPGESSLWEMMADGPVSVERLLAEHPLERQIAALVRKGLVLIAAFTPTDATHVAGIHTPWSVEAATLGALSWSRRNLFGDFVITDEAAENALRFAQRVLECVVVQSGETLIGAALNDEHAIELKANNAVAQMIVRRSLEDPATAEPGLLDISVKLNCALMAIGAPAHVYYPAISERLGTTLLNPPHADVCNAVGAVASGVMQIVKVLITQPEQGRFRVHLGSNAKDFSDLAKAADYAEKQASELAAEQALGAGAEAPEVKLKRVDHTADVGGEIVFLESEISAIAVGRPQLSDV